MVTRRLVGVKPLTLLSTPPQGMSQFLGFVGRGSRRAIANSGRIDSMVNHLFTAYSWSIIA